MRGGYILSADKVPLPCFDVLEWANWVENNRDACLVGLDVTDEYRVSTVFLTLDHNFRFHGDPVLFETMVFFTDGEYGDMDRYSSWAEALAGHERIRSMLARESADAEVITLAKLAELLADIKASVPGTAEKD